nr:MAG TPA: hypothetical protein [Caudoviricetes sp.]
MKSKEKLTPKDYDRWGRTCIKLTCDPPKIDTPKEDKVPEKTVKTPNKGK